MSPKVVAVCFQGLARHSRRVRRRFSRGSREISLVPSLERQPALRYAREGSALDKSPLLRYFYSHNATMKLFSTFFLLWSLAEVHSEQTFPYVSFMGQTLANHSYVDLGLVGNVNVSSVQCITDLQSCCSNAHRGSWFFPNGTTLQLSGGVDIHLFRTAQRVDLRRTVATSPSGIYRCYIATVAVHDDNDLSVRETVYVGIYGLGGSVSLFTN